MIEVLLGLFITISIILGAALYITINRSNEKIETETNAQAETRKRIEDLYQYLNSLKSSTVYIDDPIISEIYRNCIGLLDYFDYIYYKTDLEKAQQIHSLMKDLKDLTGQEVLLTPKGKINSPVEMGNVENMGTLTRV